MPRTWSAAILVLAAGGAWALQPQPGAAVMPRGAVEASLGEPAAVTAEGVAVVREKGADGKPVKTALVGWDRVREVTGPLAGEAGKYAATADKAWRARVRLERGDWVAAEPLFEELFTAYRDRTGPTALMVSGGLLRCRLARGGQTAAVEPWVAWVRAQGAALAQPGAEPLAESVGAEVSKLLDPGTALAPTLPPMWLAGPAVQALASLEVPPTDSSGRLSAGEVRGNSMLTLYILAARAEVGMTVALPDKAGATADVGVRFVYDILKSRVGDEGQRRDARRALNERMMAKTSPWMEAWCRMAVGRSLLVEKGEEERRMGLASLAYVASRSAPADAYLTGLALADMALALSRDGMDAAAGVLANEAADRFPDHPALDSPLMSRWMLARAGRKSAGGGGGGGASAGTQNTPAGGDPGKKGDGP